MPQNASQEDILKKITGTEQNAIPAYLKELIGKNTDQREGGFVLRAEQLNWAFVERIRLKNL